MDNDDLCRLATVFLRDGFQCRLAVGQSHSLSGLYGGKDIEARRDSLSRPHQKTRVIAEWVKRPETEGLTINVQGGGLHGG